MPAQAGSLAVLRRRLRVWLDEICADPEEVSDIVASCGEACANSIEHASPNDRETLVVRGSLRPDAIISISVRDFGRWQRSERRPERGRGFLIIRSLMHEVVVRRGDEGTEVIMYRRLRRPSGPSRSRRAGITIQGDEWEERDVRTVAPRPAW
jgi:anti-sigma regulatory factor (Ser/Thr protein kinase)